MSRVVKMLVFEDGTIGYTTNPEGVDQAITIDNNPLAHEEVLHGVSEKKLHKMMEESVNKKAVKDKHGKFIIKDKTEK